MLRYTLLFLLCWLAVGSPHRHPAHDFVEVRHGKQARIFCRKCGAEITTRGNHVKAVTRPDRLVRVTPDPEGALVGDAPVYNLSNPQGQDFQVALFDEALRVSPHGDPSEVATFFPPFKWQVVTCNRCQAHLGWRFLGPQNKQKTCAKKSSKPKPHLKLWTNIVDKALRNKCLVFRAGWWNFQYCHRKEIRQYHPEPNGGRGEDWSLGLFSSSGVKPLVHMFTEGQRCDETSTGRSTEVTFENCVDDHSDAAHAALQEGESAYIKEIREPAVCKYAFVICMLVDGTENTKHSSTHTSCSDEGGTEATRGAASNSTTALTRFHGLLWPNLVAEDADELMWVHQMKLRL